MGAGQAIRWLDRLYTGLEMIMLTLTIKQLRDSLSSFTTLAQQPIVNVRLAYNLSKTLKALQEEAKHVSEQESAIFQQYGGEQKRLPNGAQAWTVDIENWTKEKRRDFELALSELADLTIEVWGSKITLDQIEAASLKLSAADFALLSWLIQDEDEHAPGRAQAANL